jgi:hypothetical protein
MSSPNGIKKKNRKRSKPAPPGSVRTTIMLAKVIYEAADRLMDQQGYNGNFSAYVAALIRRDREEHEKRFKP